MTKEIHTIMRCLAADTEAERTQALQELKAMLRSEPAPASTKVENMILDALADLGVPDRLRGHGHLVYAINAVIRDPDYAKRATARLYPDVAQAFGTSPTCVDRNMRHAIEVGQQRMDLDAMTTYFGNTVSPDRGKLTNTEFITRVANVVRRRLQTENAASGAGTSESGTDEKHHQ